MSERTDGSANDERACFYLGFRKASGESIWLTTKKERYIGGIKQR